MRPLGVAHGSCEPTASGLFLVYYRKRFAQIFAELRFCEPPLNNGFDY